MNSFRRKKINLVKMGQTAIKFTPFVIPIMCSIESNAMLNKGPKILSITNQLLRSATRSSQNVSSTTSTPSKLNINSIAKRLRQSSTYTPTSSGSNQHDFIPVRSMDARTALGAIKHNVATSSISKRNPSVQKFISQHSVTNIIKLDDAIEKPSYSISKTNTTEAVRLFEKLSSTSTISHSKSTSTSSRSNIPLITRQLQQSSSTSSSSNSTSTPARLNISSIARQLQQSSTTSPSSSTATPSRTRVSLLMKNFEN